MNLTEHHINIQDEKYQKERKLTHEQIKILWKLNLYNVLLFGAGQLNPEQKALSNKLIQEYFKSLKPGDEVEIGMQDSLGGMLGIVVSNDGEKIKIQSGFGNKKKKNGIRSFSARSGYSSGPASHGKGDSEMHRFYIKIPDSHTVKSTKGIPQELLDEIEIIYKQAGDPKTCYDIVNTLKYGEPKDDADRLLNLLLLLEQSCKTSPSSP